MQLDYFTLLSPEPIQLSIGSIKNPTARDVGKISMQRFSLYQVLMKLTPSDYYHEVAKDRLVYWDALTDEQKQTMTMWDLLQVEPEIIPDYLDMLNFFFVERVIFKEKVLAIIDTDDYKTPDEELEITDSNLKGVLFDKNFAEVMDILQQVCCIKSADPMDEPMPKFKNEKAKKLYERMLKAKKGQEKKQEEKDAVNLVFANIISSVAAKSNNLNIVNIWDATIFQIYDQFKKLRTDDMHYINAVRVAVWGDEKKQFDDSLWYKNNFKK